MLLLLAVNVQQDVANLHAKADGGNTKWEKPKHAKPKATQLLLLLLLGLIAIKLRVKLRLCPTRQLRRERI